MAPYITRRDLLKLAGGSALGVIFSPLPWKLLDDSAIWTQNWSGIPKLAHGPFTVRYSACTLCSAGCALQARCAGTIPVTLGGVTGHPLTSGSLCPIGFASHHMAHHPLRLAGPVRVPGIPAVPAWNRWNLRPPSRHSGNLSAPSPRERKMEPLRSSTASPDGHSPSRTVSFFPVFRTVSTSSRRLSRTKQQPPFAPWPSPIPDPWAWIS